jgi:hypothetical protein
MYAILTTKMLQPNITACLCFPDLIAFSRNLMRFPGIYRVFTEFNAFSRNLMRFHGIYRVFTEYFTFSRISLRFPGFYFVRPFFADRVFVRSTLAKIAAARFN